MVISGLYDHLLEIYSQFDTSTCGPLLYLSCADLHWLETARDKKKSFLF